MPPRAVLVDGPTHGSGCSVAAAVQEAADSAECLPRRDREGEEIARRPSYSHRSLGQPDRQPSAYETSYECSAPGSRIQNRSAGCSVGSPL